MTEAIAILRGLFADGPFSFAGRHYTITDLDGQPKPVQRPHPPFIVGGTRERVLRLAAREGDIVGLDLRQDRESLPDAWPGRMDTRVDWVRDEAGPRFEHLDLSVLRIVGPIAITPNAREAAQRVADAYRATTGLEIEPDDIIESPYSIDRHDPEPGRQAPPVARSLGHQLVSARLVRRARARPAGAARGAARRDLAVRRRRRAGLP